MKRRLRALLSEQRGNVLVFTSLCLVALLVLTGFVIDGGMLMATRAQMQKAANAAALSAAQELTYQEAAVGMVATETLQAHGEHEHMDMLEITMQDRVRVGLTDTMPLGFAGVFGIPSANVSVAATARIGVMGSAIGAAPLGIDESISLVFNQEYKLKVDNTGVESGNFGVLALGDTGAATYEDNLRNGYQGSVGIADILDTQTGNIAGKTRTVISELITNCPYPLGETHHRDCPRVLLIPVYRPYNFESNQLKSVEITGFAYFYITAPMSPKDTSITGMFIKRTGAGIVNAGAADKGAYAIRLTE